MYNMKRKCFAYLFVILIFINMLGRGMFIANAEELSSATSEDILTLEDVLAGLGDISDLSNSVNLVATLTQLVSNGTYCLNGKYSGDYLRNSSSTIVATSGKIALLGDSIQWQITYVNGYYTIRSSNDLSKYLAVPTAGSANPNLQLVTIGTSTIPTQCLWNITIADGGACLVQNVYNSRYLFSNGTSVYTTDSLGELGSSVYDSRVWRIMSPENISSRELGQSSVFSNLSITVGGTGIPSMLRVPSNAIWATSSDFTYSRKVTSHVNVSDGIFTGISTGVTTIVATHKVTDLQFMFAVIVGNEPSYTIRNHVDQGYCVRFGSDSNVITCNTVVADKFAHFFGLNSSSQYVLHTSSADICKINQTGSVTNSNLTIGCPHNTSHLTKDALHAIMGSGTSTTSYVLWTGHILPGNPPSSSYSDFSVIITPNQTTNSNYVNKSDAEVRMESLYTLMHELSHQLGAPDHYCYGVSEGDSVCINSNCDICYMGKTVARECMMSYRRDIENWNECLLYCTSCLSVIDNHLTEHHQ